METIRGRRSLDLDLNGLLDRLTNYKRVLLDLGTGDGRYVRYLADRYTDAFVIGIDACRENLQEHSRTKSPNALFIIANAQELPHELYGLVSRVTINFPWGSLLESLLLGDANLMQGLACISQPNTRLDILLNGGALTQAGTDLAIGTGRIYDHINRQGWHLKTPNHMDVQSLRDFPTTWAKRLAYGRDPSAMSLTGSFPA